MNKTGKIILYLVAALVFTSFSTALDIRSSEALEYYNDGSLEFQVDQTGQISAYNDLDMQGSSILSPGQVDGVDVGSPGNAIGIDGSNQYYVPSGAIAGNELASSYETGAAYDDRFVYDDGDAMTGNLDMRGNSLLDVGGLNMGKSEISFSTSSITEYGGDALAINSDDNVIRLQDSSTQDIRAESDLDMDGNNINSFFASACASGQAVVQVYGSGGYQCMDVSGEVSGDYVNRSGDSMTGNLDMRGNDIQDVRRLEGDTHEFRFDTSSDYIELTDSGGSRDDLVLGDIYIDDSVGWLASSNIATVGSGNHMSGGGSFGLGGSTTLDVDAGSVLGTANDLDSSGNIQSGTVGGDELTSSYETGAAHDSRFVNTDGDAMSGGLDVNNEPIRSQRGIILSHYDNGASAERAQLVYTDQDLVGDGFRDGSWGYRFMGHHDDSHVFWVDNSGGVMDFNRDLELSGNDIGGANSITTERITATAGSDPIRVGRSSGENSIAANGQSWVGYGGGSSGILLGYYDSDEVRIGDGSSSVQVRGSLDMEGNSISNVNTVSANSVEASDSFQLPVGTDQW